MNAVTQFDYWGLLAGVALFLFAMAQMETGLKTLGGRSLANYLQRQADKRLNAVLAGMLGTIMVQSSSVVSLMALAFTGAGLLKLPAALGIIFGSNLGTTLTGWIVATLGFKLEIFRLALPLIGIGGLTCVFGQGRWSEYGRAVLGLGLLLLGLQLMKTSVEALQQLIDINDLAGLSAWQYLVFGVVVTAVIQASAATVMLTLAALHAGIIDLPNAAAVAIGADLGTTTTVIIGAIKGSQTKRQVAAGHVLFNVITDAVAFALRIPLLALIALAGIDDPLYALVAFHSLFNLLGLLVFVPLTVPFATLLQRIFPQRDRLEASYLVDVERGVSEAAVGAVERETSLLIARATRLSMQAFDPPLASPSGHPPVPHLRGIAAMQARPFDELYRRTKTLEGELLEFAIRLQANPLDTAATERLGQMLNAAREAMHSAKAIKDIRHNLVELNDPAQAALNRYSAAFRQAMTEFLTDVYALRETDDDGVEFADLVAALQRVAARHERFHETIYADVREDAVGESQVSTLLNVNREILICCRSLLLALGCYYLDHRRSEDLEHLAV